MEFINSLPAGGTIFNSIAVLIGGAVGLTIGKFIPERLQTGIFNCLGMFTLYVGINMCLQTKHAIAVLLALVTGNIIGDLLMLEEKLNNLSDTVKAKLNISSASFTEGLVSATLLFCVGSMAIIGSFEDGIRHNASILMTKGVMDGIASIMFASSFGIGVIFSIFPMFIYQGSITLLASLIESYITPDMYANISGVGGLMIMGIGLNMLKITKLNLGDMLPGLIYVIFLTLLF